MTKPPKAPSPNASKADHKRNAEAFLKLEEFKKKPVGFQDKTDDAKP